MTKQATVRINSFRRKSGAHPVISPRKIVFSKKFKTSSCKIGELVMAYELKANNKTSCPRTFYTLYIEPNYEGPGPLVVKLSMK